MGMLREKNVREIGTMAFFSVMLHTLLSAVVLFLLTKWMGNKQMSQLNLFDYITGITIGSLAAELALDDGSFVWPTLVSILLYGFLAFGLSFITQKSLLCRRFFSGYPLVLFRKGELSYRNLRRARLDVNDFLTMARIAGYYSLRDVEEAVLEINGAISFLPVAEKRPVTPGDLSLSVSPSDACVSVILDGVILNDHLKRRGFDRKWLYKMLDAQGYKSEKEILLCLVESDGQCSFYPKKTKQNMQEVFE